MTLQARMSQSDPRLYNVNRDIAHNFDYIVMEIAKCVEERKWPALTKLAQAHNVSDTDVGLCCEALCKFIGIQADNPKESMANCLSRCGFLDLPEMARVVVMAYLGNIMLGVHWAGVREATLAGQGPALGYKKLRWWGRKMAMLMTLPRWKRRLYRFKERCRRGWRAFWEKSTYDG